MCVRTEKLATVEIHLYTYQVGKFNSTRFFNSKKEQGVDSYIPLPLPCNPRPGPHCESLEKASDIEQIRNTKRM